MKSFMFNLVFRPPTFTFLSSSSSSGDGSLFHGCSFPCQCILLRGGGWCSSFPFPCRLISFLFFLCRRFFLFCSLTSLFFLQAFSSFPYHFTVFLFSFLVFQQHVHSFLFLSFPSPQPNGTFLSQPQVMSCGQLRIAS